MDNKEDPRSYERYVATMRVLDPSNRLAGVRLRETVVDELGVTLVRGTVPWKGLIRLLPQSYPGGAFGPPEGSPSSSPGPLRGCASGSAAGLVRVIAPVNVEVMTYNWPWPKP